MTPARYPGLLTPDCVRLANTRPLVDADAAGDVHVTMGRAADYFGPMGLMSCMGERVFHAAFAGKNHIPDIAAGLATLGSVDRGRPLHVPRTPTTAPTAAPASPNPAPGVASSQPARGVNPCVSVS